MIQKITLTNFRCFHEKKIETNHPIVFFTGTNGCGKTSVLEAISLLSPGNGLRSLPFASMVCDHRDKLSLENTYQWSLHFALDDYAIGMGYTQEGARVLKKDAKPIKLEEITKLFSVFWLVPMHDHVLVDESSGRRKFLDRMCYNVDPTHLSNLVQYDRLRKERLAILKKNTQNLCSPHVKNWLESLESQLVTYGQSVTRTRKTMLQLLEKNQDKAILNFRIDWDKGVYWEEDPEICRASWIKNRELDAKIGKSMFGSHKADWSMTYQKRLAKNCSMGEQKALVLSLVLSFVSALERKKILLLDDVLSHFDAQTQTRVLETLLDMQTQVFLTSPEPPKNTSSSFFIYNL